MRDAVTTRLRFFTAQGLAQVADAIATIVIADVVLDGPDGVEPADLLSTLGAATLPYLVAGPVSGMVADRWDRRQTLLVVHLARAALAVLAAGAVAADGRLAGLIAVFGLLTGARFAYNLRAAALPHLAGQLSREHARLVALDALALRVAAVAIAAGGALAAATGGAAPISLLFLASALHVAAGLIFVSVGCDLGGRSAARAHAGTSLAGVAAHLGRLLTGPGSRLAISVTSTHRFLLGATFATFVLIAANDFGFGPRGYVVASAVTGCGSMLGTVTAPRCSAALGMQRLVGMAFGAPAALLLATGSVRAEAFLAVAVGAAFFVFQNLRVVADATVQASIDDHARARVFSVYDALYNVSYFAGAAAALAFSDASRPELLVWIAAGYLVLAVALVPRVGGRMPTPTHPADVRHVFDLSIVRGAA